MMLFRLLSWPYLRKHIFRWILTIGGIVLGSGLFVAMQTANRSLFSGFDETIDQIGGSTQLQVSAGEFGFDESILERVQAVPEVGVAVPVIEAIVDTQLPGQGSVLLLGIDMTGDRSLRSYNLDDEDSVIDDPLVFLAQPDSLIVTREFADRNGLRTNSRIPLVTIEGERLFTVRGIMESGGLTQAFGGNLAVIDIYAAQAVLGRGRRFDRIDLRAKEGVTIDQSQQAIRNAVGPGFEVEPPAARGRHFEALLQDYSTAMDISSLFALLVGMFIIYNSFAIAVNQRRFEIGILRALGATRGQIQRLFFVESALAGLVGSILGTGLGLAIARIIAGSISSVIEESAGVPQRISSVSVEPILIVSGIVIGVGTSIFAAWIPARNASNVDPVRALQKGKYQVLTAGENRTRRRVAFALCITFLICLFLSRSKALFYIGYFSMILAGVLLAPAFTLLASKAIRPILQACFRAEGKLAGDSLIQAPRRTSSTVSALMLSLAMVIGFGGFANSFYSSVQDWIDSNLNSDFFVSPSANLVTRALTFPGQLSSVIENVEGVEQVQLVRNARLIFRQVPVMVLAIETQKFATTMRRAPVSGDSGEMNRLAAEGKGLIASEAFSSIHNLNMGDVVQLPTPSGLLNLPIVGVVRDYTDLQGSVFIDRSVYIKWWNDDTANLARVYIRKGQDPGVVRQRVINALAGRGRLLVLTNREVQDWIMKLIDQWFAMTYNQIAVAILVALLGIVNTLTISITDRRKELGVMQAVGGLRNQVRHTIWLEALSIGVIGLILGIGLGAVNLYYTLGVVQRDIGGFNLDYLFPFSLVLFMVPTILVAAFIAAIGPAESAVRATLVEALEYE